MFKSNINGESSSRSSKNEKKINNCIVRDNNIDDSSNTASSSSSSSSSSKKKKNIMSSSSPSPSTLPSSSPSTTTSTKHNISGNGTSTSSSSHERKVARSKKLNNKNINNSNNNNNNKHDNDIKNKNKVKRSIISYLPRRLQNYVVHYHDDFFISPYFDPNLIIELMYEGFLPIATTSNASPRSQSVPTHYLLPKLHEQRCVLYFSNLHISKNPRKKSSNYILKVNSNFDGVVEGCHNQHGIAWLYPPMVQALKYIFVNNDKYARVKVYSIELYKKIPLDDDDDDDDNELKDTITNTNDNNNNNQNNKKCKNKSKAKAKESNKPKKYKYSLEAGELGYTVHNKIYTSLTGFYNASGTGTIQLLALAGLLKKFNYELWDLGMEMEYKMNLGAICLDRDDFVSEFHKLRNGLTTTASSTSNSTSSDSSNNLNLSVEKNNSYEARDLIDTFK